MANKKIFVSYSRSDKDVVERLVDSLRKEGLDVWYDNHIRAGDKWEKTLKSEIQGAEIMVMVLSERSSDSENVNNEMHYARQVGTHIIPIKIEECEPPLGLASAHYIDFIKDFDQGYSRLVEDILGQEATERPTKKKGTQNKGKGLLRNTKAKVIGIVLLSIVVYFGYSALKPDPPIITKQVTVKPLVKIEGKLVGRSLFLGVVSDATGATGKYDTGRFLWNHVTIRIENNCKESLYFDSSRFRLHISKNRETDGAVSFSPTTQAMEYQTKRLKSQWLEPGKILTGDLFFKVPESKLSNGHDMNKTYAYNILRYSLGQKCDIEYTPY